MRLKGYPTSNRDHTRLNGRLRLDRGGGGMSGLSGGVPWPLVELVRLGPRARYMALFSLWFGSTGSQERGESI
jgi:hypothetical protein